MIACTCNVAYCCNWTIGGDGCTEYYTIWLFAIWMDRVFVIIQFYTAGNESGSGKWFHLLSCWPDSGPSRGISLYSGGRSTILPGEVGPSSYRPPSVKRRYVVVASSAGTS